MNKQELLRKITDRKAAVAIVGMGYVGLPLALRFADEGFTVRCIDINVAKVEVLNTGRSYIKHISHERVAGAVRGQLFRATTDYSVIGGVDAVILCVPTPLGSHQEPDLSYMTGTLDSVIPRMRPGQLLSLESTTYPGTTDEEIISRLAGRGLKPGETVFVVFSPEREDPGNAKFTTSTIPKVVGGHTPSCLEVGIALYGAVVERVVPVNSTRAAEMTKLLENIYRSVNIGLVNELKMVCDRMGIDIWEVIEAAATKPFGFTPFYPGPGLGGHCGLPYTAARVGLQGQRGRHARISDVCPHGPIEAARGGSRVLRPVHSDHHPITQIRPLDRGEMRDVVHGFAPAV